MRFPEGGCPSRTLFDAVDVPVSGVGVWFVRLAEKSLAERCDCGFGEGLGRVPLILFFKGDLPARTLFSVADVTESAVGVCFVRLE